MFVDDVAGYRDYQLTQLKGWSRMGIDLPALSGSRSLPVTVTDAAIIRIVLDLGCSFQIGSVIGRVTVAVTGRMDPDLQ